MRVTANAAVGGNVSAKPEPAPEFASIGERLSSLTSRLVGMNDEMLRFRGNVFGEGEPPAETASKPVQAGLLGSIYDQINGIEDLLDRAERQLASIRRLG